MISTRRTACVLGVFVQLAGCAGSGDGLDASGRPITPGGGADGPLTPDFESIQAHVFTPICTQCHVGANAPQGLRLDAANSYGALVGVASSEQPGIMRVRPGDSAASYIVQKLEGNAAVGARMPLNQPALPDATILVIRQWIDAGASRTAAAQAQTLTVETVSVGKTQVAVATTRPVDAALVNDTNVQLQRLDAGTGRPSPVLARVSVSPVNDSLIVIEPDSGLAAGRYRLTLRGSGPAALADWTATLLDGDGDGLPGGDFVRTYDVGEVQ